jgi:hypothetical protein
MVEAVQESGQGYIIIIDNKTGGKSDFRFNSFHRILQPNYLNGYYQ